ncbi:MAG: hypothetical protein KGY76_06840 [Candidatus Thermoplasmatota archaeon]|nr:hypothetical protein [Candidatus Thermoplasmatota archaeon]
MNEKDLTLVKRLMEEVDEVKKDDPCPSILFDTSFTQIAKTNLLLLKGFLDIKDKKGYFVVLDRPHQYMAYLLHMHDVSQENIWYIDTVTHMSGQEKVEGDNVDFVEGPFHIEKLFEAFKPKGENQSHFASPEEIDFVLIDNISSMLNYNSMDKVEDFIGSFRELIEESDAIVGGLVIDNESHPELNEVIRKHLDKFIDIEDIKEELGYA